MEFQFTEETQQVETLDGVPSQFHSFYTEQEGGGYALRVDDPVVKTSVEAIGGLAKSLKAARAEVGGLRGKSVDLSALGEYGSTPEEIASGFQSKVQEYEEKLASTDEAKIDLNKLRQDMEKANAKAQEQNVRRIQALEQQLYTLLVENAATQAIAEAKGSPELLLPFVKQQVKVIEEDGEMQVYVVDGDNRRYSGVTGQPMTVKELITEMKSDNKYGRLFESEAPEGGGARPAARPGPGAARPPAEKSSTDKIAAGLDKHTKGRVIGAGAPA